MNTHLLQLITIYGILYLSQLCSSVNYAVAYVFENSNKNALLQGEIIIEEKGRFNSQVKMTSATEQSIQSIFQRFEKQRSQQHLQLKKIPQNTLSFKKSSIPQMMWIGNVQIIIVEIDVASLLNYGNNIGIDGQSLDSRLKQYNKQQIVSESYQNIANRYSKLLRHKGQSIFIFNSQELDPDSEKVISKIFKLSQLNSTQICQIDMHLNTIDKNMNKIEQCFLRKMQKTVKLKMLYHKQTTISEDFFQTFGVYSLVFVLLGVITSLFHPFWIVKKQKAAIEDKTALI